jgi:predicted esterase
LKKVSLTKLFVMNRFAYPKIFAAIFSVFLCSGASAQSCDPATDTKCCAGFTYPMRQTKVPGVTFSGTNFFNGLVQYLPPGYNPAGSQLYPLIIYFHGVGELGNGSNADLCKVLNLYSNGENNPFDVPLPERIELGELPTVTNNGTTYNFVVLSPQYNQYSFPGNYPSAADVAAIINYAIANYKVDPTRIYLTGMSSGANMVIEYAAASQTNASRVAAIAMASLCSSVGNSPQGPANIANADLPFWEVHCTNDNNPFCPDSISTNWVNAINNYSNPPTPLAKKTTLPITGWPCVTLNEHNTWNTLYNPNFRVDGTNVYEWLIQYARTAGAPLPANMKNYNAVLRGSKVYVEWITTAENNTDRFVLERATANGQYQEVASVMAAGASAADKKYVLIDEQPVRGLNLYRLVLVNRDGQREYFDVKRITLPNGGGFVNIPSPARGTLNVYLNVDRSQTVNITVHDLNGRILHRVSRVFAPGLSENRVAITTLSAGTYFVKVEGESFTETRKVLVN